MEPNRRTRSSTTGAKGNRIAAAEVRDSVWLHSSPVLPTPPTRRADLILRRVRDELVVYDTELHQAHCLNATAAAVFELCDGERTPRLIAAELGLDEEIVLLALEDLRAQRLVEGGAAISRRAFVRGVGVAAAVSLPVITSLAVPPAAAAQSCFPEGAACVIDQQCCSQNCNDGVCGPPL